MGEGLFDQLDGSETPNILGSGWKTLCVKPGVPLSKPQQQQLVSATRIAVDVGINSTKNWKNLLLDSDLMALLADSQQVVKILLPVYSYQRVEFEGEIPNWTRAQFNQEEEMLYWSALLPNSSILFIKDYLRDTPIPPLLLLCQRISEGVIYAPDTLCGFSDSAMLEQAIKQEMFAPNEGSVLVQTQNFLLSSIMTEVVWMYQSMYRSKLTVQLVRVVYHPLLPFSCRTKSIPSSINDLARALVSHLPSPAQAEEFSDYLRRFLLTLPPIQKTTIGLDAVRDEPEVARLDRGAPISPTPTQTIAVSTTLHVTNQADYPPMADEADIQLTADVKKIFRSTIGETKKTTTSTKTIKRKKILIQSRKRKTLFYMGVLFIFVGIGVATLLGVFQYSVAVARSELSRVLEHSSLSSGKTEVSWGALPTHVSLIETQLQIVDAVFDLPLIDEANDIIIIASLLKNAEKTTLEANQSLISAFRSIWSSSGDATLLSSSEVLAERLLTQRNSVEALLEKVSTLDLSNGGLVLGVSQTPDDGSSAIVRELTPILGGLLGDSQKKSYALLLQNSQELRATGGFIEAFAILNFAGGTLTNIEVYSSYDVDLKLGDVAPPSDLQSVLGEDNWWFRDANWSPDAEVSSKQVVWFLEQALSKKIDGVIVLNSISLPNLLAATGPIQLSEFNEVVTEKNIAELLEYHTELPQQATNSNSEYRVVLLQRLIAKMAELSDEQILALIPVLHQQLVERQLLIYASDEQAQQVFSRLGWSGSFVFPSCPTPFAQSHCEVDGVAQVETNVGINRANAYIDRASEHTIALQANLADHNHRTTWSNRAQTQAWPKGDYRVYVRTYIPRQATNISATINGELVPTADIRKLSTSAGDEIGLTVIVPINQTVTLDLSYQTPVSLTDGSAYLFFQMRQPGISTPLSPVLITLPETWHVGTVAPQPESMPPTLQFSGSSAAQSVVVVQFDQVK